MAEQVVEKVGLKITELLLEIVNEGGSVEFFYDSGGNSLSISVSHENIDSMDHHHMGTRHGELKALEKELIRTLKEYRDKVKPNADR